MKALVTTLTARIEAADALFEQGRVGAAATAFRDVLDKAQDASDRGAEIVSRAMIARCVLASRPPDVDEAADHLRAVEYALAEQRLEVQARVQAARARLALASPGGGPEDARAYLSWADEHGHAASVVDACVLLARASAGEERATWLGRAVDEAEISGRIRHAGVLAMELGGVLDGLGRHQEAIGAYRRALGHQQSHGTPRGVVSAAWAKGAVQARLEDEPDAREALEYAVAKAENVDEARDLLALALADLARVVESAGDVVEARRLVIRAVRIAKEEDLPSLWPARWQALVRHGRALELEL